MPRATDRDPECQVARARRQAVHVSVERHARERPAAAAIIDGSLRRTWAELARRTDSLAAHLAARGVGRGDRVALFVRNSITFPEVMIAAHKIGAVVVPINFRLAPPEVRFQLDDCEPVALISDRESRANLPDDVTVGVHLTTGDPGDGLESVESMLDDQRDPPIVDFDPADVAFIMYTSGTTGRPKGAMLTFGGVWAHTVSWIGETQAGPDDVWMNGVPMFHAAGVAGILPMLMLGATYIVSPSTPFSVTETIDLLAHHDVTMCGFVPTQWEMICRHDAASRLDTSVLRRLLWGGAQAPRDVLELMSATFPNAEILNSYGQTEMGPTTCWLHGADAIRKMGSAGRATYLVEMRIVDDDGEPVPAGTIGEVVYRGPTVMAGYWRDDEGTRAAFADGWFHSGDLARLDDEGYIYIVDRKKDMIVSGGENIYPAEVEAAIRLLEGVADVAVVGEPHPTWHETPVAYVVSHSGATLDAEMVIDHCRRHLASYKKPTRVAFVEDLPRNSTGKVLKRELKAQPDTDRVGAP